jgi:hypothetical protein
MKCNVQLPHNILFCADVGWDEVRLQLFEAP